LVPRRGLAWWAPIQRCQILRENKCVTDVPVLVEGSQVSREYDPTRVRLYVDAEAQILVVLIPAVGN
jgi:hypothetical protein